MYTLVFLVFAILSVAVLIYIQTAGLRTIFEPGLLIVLLFSLCYLLPALPVLFGFNVIPLDKTDGIETVSQYGVLFVFFFTLFYSLLKARFNKRILSASSVNVAWKPKIFLIEFLFIFILIKFVMFVYGVGDSDDYAQQYVARAGMPPLVNQAIALLQSLQWMLVCLLLVTGLASGSRKNYPRYIPIVFVCFFLDMLATNSRSNFVTLTIMFMAGYTFYRRPIGLKMEVALAFVFVSAMGVFAFRRVVAGAESSFDILNIFIPSEFIVIYLNALHLVSLSGTPEFVSPPGNSYIQSLVFFIPSQFNDGKWDLAGWYVKQYFSDYAEAGGGLAFGIIPEAIVNWGMLSIVFQAAVIACLFRFSYNCAVANRSRGANVWILFYLLSFSQIYQLIRSHSFAIISGLVLGFAVPFLILFVIGKIRWSLRDPALA